MIVEKLKGGFEPVIAKRDIAVRPVGCILRFLYPLL